MIGFQDFGEVYYIDRGFAKQGKFDAYIEETLKNILKKINKSSKIQLSPSDAKAVKDELLQPIKQHHDNLEQYRSNVRKHLENKTLDKSRPTLKEWRVQVLELSDEDVADIEQEERRRLLTIKGAKEQGSQREKYQAGLQCYEHEFEQLEQRKKEIEAEYESNLRQYEQTFAQTLRAEYPLSQASLEALKTLQKQLGLKLKDVSRIEVPMLDKKEAEYQLTIEAGTHQPSFLTRIATTTADFLGAIVSDNKE